jgi:D-alanyl-D-alanine carboxypeptidase (penicillin-binding protein 5/6)
MNRRAASLGATSSYFANPHGLPAAQYSTARDMAIAARVAYRSPLLRSYFRTESYIFKYNDGRTRKIENTNKLLKRLDYVDGMKTGTTNAAGPCLATCMDRDPVVRTKPDGTKGVTPRRLIVVVLNSPDRFNRSRKLLRDGWAFYDAWLSAGAPVDDPKREILSTPAPK